MFPVAPLGKRPLTEHGFKDASRDEAQVRAWWDRTPDANLGLPCGDNGLVVLDVDVRKAGAVEAFDALRSKDGGIPETLCVQTPSGGVHYYFAAKGLKTSHGDLGPGLDIQASGAYVVAPPSRRREGAYTVIMRHRIVEPPAWLAEFAAPPSPRPANPWRSKPIPQGTGTAYGRGALRRASEKVGTAAEGTRNRELHFAAYSLGRLVAAGHLAADDVRDALASAARGCGYEGEVGPAGVVKVVESSLSKGMEAGPRGPAPAWACR